jgi:hypothetical protein
LCNPEWIDSRRNSVDQEKIKVKRFRSLKKINKLHQRKLRLIVSRNKRLND